MSSHNVQVVPCCLVFDNSCSATDCSLRYCIGGNTVQEGTPGSRLAPKGNSSDDNSPEISARSSCGDDDDPSRGLEEFWTLQQLEKWRGLL